MTRGRDNPNEKKKKFRSKSIAERLKQNGKLVDVENRGLENDKQIFQRILRVIRGLSIHKEYRLNRCFLCESETTSSDKTKWGILPHWYRLHIRGSDYPICKTCYVRKNWQKKYVPKNSKCDRCGIETLTVSKYGTRSVLC